jgi:translation elongation factor EF-Tu-like GTPase
MAQSKVDDLTKQIQDLDAKIEAEITDLTTRLTQVKDSPDSRGRVAKVKKDFMLDLKKSIDLYKLERDKRADKIGRPGTSGQTEALSTTTEALDTHIDARADDIVAIAKSFTESDGYREYVAVYDDDGMSSNDRFETESSVQKRREGTRTTQTEKDVLTGLNRSISDLNQRITTLERRIVATPTDAERKALQAELDRATAMRDERRRQITELEQETAASGAITPLSSQQAHELDKQVDALVNQLKVDFRELLRLANEREVERARTR